MMADKWQTLSQRSSYKYISEYTIHIVINIILIQNFLRGDGDVLLNFFKNKTPPYSRLTGFAGTTPEGCSEGWMYFSQLCYRYSPHTVDAIAAKDICSSQGASLTSIWNDEEKLFLINTLLPVSVCR